MYDIIVIGKGMMGAAATRHLTLNFPDMKIAVIGPDEPAERKTHQGVFASHYDQGRITRVLDRSPLWGHMAAESIQRYADIEQESGIQFHHKVGCLRVHDEAEAIAQVEQVAAQLQPEYDVLTPDETHERFGCLHFTGEYTAFAEQGNAGYVNPRQLVAAQVNSAEKHGATIIRETVTKLVEQPDYVELATDAGQQYQTRKVLIAAGGFSNLLLERKVAWRLKAHTILRAEVNPDEVERLQAMPSLITSCANRDMPSLYMLPPVPYPDGKTYVKLGPSFREDEFAQPEHFLESRAELVEWFQSDGRGDIADWLKDAMHTLIPNLQVESYQQTPCLITLTEHGQPYIDAVVPDKIYITAGGCGASAKSSDEIGRMGALLAATDDWHSPLARDAFRAIYVD